MENNEQSGIPETSVAPKTPEEKALERCNKSIKWYKKHGRRQRIAYQSFQVLALVLSGITPILVLTLPETLKAWTALPPALAAIAVGLLGIFQWRENYVRFTYTREALKSERIKYETGSTKRYETADKETALHEFVKRIEYLILSEVAGWRGLMKETGKDDE